MLHSYTKIYLHLIWSTKNREPYLTVDARPKAFEHLIQNAREKGIYVECMNIQIDHIHLLVNLPSDQKIDDVVKLLKGESSHWINSENIIKSKFSWQRGYGAFSVSPSHIEAVRKYIIGQDEHHRKKTFTEEYKMILNKYGFTDMETDESVPE
jgi:putative transposase